MDPQEIEVATYCPPGLGGWTSVPEIGVQLTHLPSGISVRCHTHRSAHRNKVKAMEMLQILVASPYIGPAVKSNFHVGDEPNFESNSSIPLKGDMSMSIVDKLVALAQDGVVTVGVTFDSGSRRYTYKARASEGIEVGNKVVVDSPSAGYVTATVVAVDAFADIDLDKPWNYKWIVQKVDDAFYKEIQAREAAARAELEAAERRNKRAKAMLKAAEDTGMTVDELKEFLARHFGKDSASGDA